VRRYSGAVRSRAACWALAKGDGRFFSAVFTAPSTFEGDPVRWITNFCVSSALLIAGTTVSAQGISVLAAFYGQSCGAAHANVTAQVKAKCDNQTNCQYRVDVGSLGDPAPNCPKNFVVLFGCTGQPPARLVQLPAEATGRTAVLSCVVLQGPAQPQ
jgi:hypothetical protein